MKRLTILVILAILLLVSVLLGLSDAAISIAGTGIPDDELTTSRTEASNSSASATITITMTGILNE